VVYRNRSNFEHFIPKFGPFWDHVNLRFINNQIENSRLKKFSLTRSWIYEQLLFFSDNGSFNGFLQLPIRPNSIFPLSVVYGIMGWGLLVCMYSCMHVCMHKCMYISVYVCIMHA